MTEYQKIIAGLASREHHNRYDHCFLIEEISTGLQGDAQLQEDGSVAVFYGDPDGSDDMELDPELFNKWFRVLRLED